MKRRLSLTGRYFYKISNIGHILGVIPVSNSSKDRVDYNPNQPRDSRGRWSSGGGGGGGGGGGSPRRRSGGGGGGLASKKVKELQDIATKEGIDVNALSHKGRRSVLVSAIAAKRKGKDLRSEGLLKATKKKGGLRGKGKKTGFYKPKFRYDFKELTQSGKSFSAQKLKETKPSKEELDLLAKKQEISDFLFNKANKTKAEKKRAKDLIESGELTRIDNAYQKLKAQRDLKNAKEFDEFRIAIKKENGMSPTDIKKLVDEINFEGMSPAHRDRVKADLIDFYELTGGKGGKSLKTVKTTADRPYANSSSNLINIGERGYSKGTLMHEAAHHMEYEIPAFNYAAKNWRNDKAESSQLQSMNELANSQSYDQGEQGIKGQFISPYVGKVYLEDNGRERGATEVISMGVEYFESPLTMRELKEKDPEHFNLIVGMLVN